MSEPIDITEAWGLVTRLADHARAQRLTDAQLVRALPMLGSARSWRRLAAQDWGAMPLEQWVPKLREAVAAIAAPGQNSAGADVPLAAVIRHLNEADHSRRLGHLTLARGHCRAAREAIATYQRQLA